MMKARQFVNVVTEKCRGNPYSMLRAEASAIGSYSLYRVRASDLFYGSTEEALMEADQEAMAGDSFTKVVARSRLPKPHIKFNQSRPVDARMDFWPFYGAKESSKILCVDAAGQAVLYDADVATLETLPRLSDQIGSESRPAVTLSVTLPDAHDPARPDALYVMDHIRGSFEALAYGDPSPYLIGRSADKFVWRWRWRQLPMPPFVRGRNHGLIVSYALLPDGGGGGTICVSSMGDGVGTYCFDTARERWTKAGSWKLPFFRRAQVVPELDGLCFGIAYRSPTNLCAVDLSSISMDDGGSAPPPTLLHQWPIWESPDSSWMGTNNPSMAYMGAGKFCIATTFRIHDKDTSRAEAETVLNGVEVVREDEKSASKSKLRMIRHKFVRFGLLNHRIHVL